MMNNCAIRPKLSYLGIKPIHPFPARMAAEIALDKLGRNGKNLRVLDPMVGSGTTMAVACRHGHQGIGFDTDPLAVLITKVWCSKIDSEDILALGKKVLIRAKAIQHDPRYGTGYPVDCSDEETRKYIRYWFDATNRRQLSSLSKAINEIDVENNRNVIWCAFSRMIIKKSNGVSLANDVSHSRPHRVVKVSDKKAFDVFEESLRRLVNLLVLPGEEKNSVKVRMGDARKLPLRSNTIDIVITSPPYFNAIDYLRGHRLSLVWMGYSIAELRGIRSGNIGSESSAKTKTTELYQDVIDAICSKKAMPPRLKAILGTYLYGLDKMVEEISRVLVPKGKAIFVVGNSICKGVYIKNSEAVKVLCMKNRLKILEIKNRRLPANRRYLPPPSANVGPISNRMRTEVVMTFIKQ